MSSPRFKQFLQDNPRGVTWSYCVRFSGLQHMYSDGRGSWARAFQDPYIDLQGTLVNRDWKFGFRSDPQEPFVTGDELSFTLVDNGSGELDRIWAPDYKGDYRGRITERLYPDHSNPALIELDTGDTIPAGTILHFGALETMQVVQTLGPGEVYCTRAMFQTRVRDFRVAGNKIVNLTNATALGVEATSSPTVYKNRIAELFMAPVNPDTREIDMRNVFPIWAGIIQNVIDNEGKIEIKCSPLSTLVESSWPGRLASGKLYNSSNARVITASDIAKGLKFWYNKPMTTPGYEAFFSSETRTVPLGEYNDAIPPVFSLLDPDADNGRYSLSYLIKVLNDTMTNFLATETGAPWEDSGDFFFKNKFQLELRPEDDGGYTIRTTVYGYNFPITGMDGLGFQFEVKQGVGVKVQTISAFAALKKEDTEIAMYLDDPYVLPGDGAWWISDSVQQSMIRISDGTNSELITFEPGNVTVDDSDDRLVFISDVVRGVGMTASLDWGWDEEEKKAVKTDAVLTELMFMSDTRSTADISDFGEYLDPDMILLAILLSAESRAPSVQDNTDYVEYTSGRGTTTPACRVIGYRQALAIPKRYVDYVGIYRTMRRSGAADTIGAFWVEEVGKGKEALKEFMKLYGLFLVAKQFERDGEVLFGLGVESVAHAVSTSYDDEITDSDRSMNTPVTNDRNERLVINVVSLTPWQKPALASRSDTDPIIVYDETSIDRYGQAKTLEIKANISDLSVSNPPGVGRAAHITAAVLCGQRWSGAFGRGPYLLKLTGVAPTSWRYYVGQHVLITLTGVRDSKGNRNISGRAGRISRVEHNHGNNARSEIDIYVGDENRCEFAPSARVTAITSSSLTLDAAYFGTDTANTDASFFDPDDYGGDIEVEVWTEGQYATTKQALSITSRSGNVVAVDTNISGASVATNLSGGARTLMGFVSYTGTARQKAYAHLADTSGEIVGDTAKEYS